MNLDELFRNLGHFAATMGTQFRDCAKTEGVPLEELDLTGPAPREVSLLGPAQVVLSEGEVFRVDTEPGSGEPMRFTLDDERLSLSGGGRDTVVRIVLPAPRAIALAGSGGITVEKLAENAKVSVAGSGRIEIADVAGGKIAASIAGSGRLVFDGRADELELSIAGSGSCDADGLSVGKAAVHIAGSGDAIFACDGEVEAHLMGSGNVIVRGSARCSVHSMGSGTVTCERDREAAD